MVEPSSDRDIERGAFAGADGASRRASNAQIPVSAVVLFTAAIVGTIAGWNPLLGLGLAVATVGALIVTFELALGVCAFLLIAYLDVWSAGSDLSVTKLAGALLIVGWLAAAATRGAAGRDLVSGQPWLTLALVTFLAWSGLSAIWADSTPAVFRSTIRFGLNALLIPVVYLAVQNRRHVIWLYWTFIVGALASVAYGLVFGKLASGAAADQVGRIAGARAEANALAALLLVACVFAAALMIIQRRGLVLRLLAAGSLVLGLVAFFATFSRAGLVALVAAVLAAVLFAGRSRAAFAAFAVVVMIVGGLYLQNTTSKAAARLAATTSSGRLDIWTVAGRMVAAHPVIGVGSGNFVVVAPHYLLYPGVIERDEFILTTPKVVHNAYLQVLAEMGIVGLVLFLAVLALSIGAAVRAVAIFQRLGDHAMEVAGRVLVVALIGVLVTDFFLSEQYSKQLWVLLGVGPALLAMARRDAEQAIYGQP